MHAAQASLAGLPSAVVLPGANHYDPIDPAGPAFLEITKALRALQASSQRK